MNFTEVLQLVSSQAGNGAQFQLAPVLGSSTQHYPQGLTGMRVVSGQENPSATSPVPLKTPTKNVDGL